jgi:hypothetical protein
VEKEHGETWGYNNNKELPDYLRIILGQGQICVGLLSCTLCGTGAWKKPATTTPMPLATSAVLANAQA